jgi:hypothetical protein
MANDSLNASDAGRAASGALVGAGYGAVIGSSVPVLGTAVGAGVGAVVGGLIGLASGGPDAEEHKASFGNRSIDARQIWEQIHGGPGSGSLHEGHGAAGELQKTHDARVGQIAALNKEMDAAWQGDGAQAAQAGAHPLETWMRDSARNLDNSGRYLGAQAASFDTVKPKVQEIAQKAPESGFLDGMNPTSDTDEQIEKYNKQGQANVDAFNQYFGESAENARGMPRYNAWDGNRLSDPGSGDHRTPSGYPGGHQPGMTGGVPGSVPGGYKPELAQMPHTGNMGQHGMPQMPHSGYQPTTPGFNDSTSASSYTPPSFNSGGFGPGSGGFGPAGFGPGSGGFGPGAGGSGGFGPVGSGGAGAGDFGAGGGAMGFGPMGGGAGGAGASTGSAAPGAAGAGRAGGMGGAAASGRPGMNGMGGMGAGGGKGGGKGAEDEEHQSKYLVSEDANELFGTDELTAPPVIGE